MTEFSRKMEIARQAMPDRALDQLRQQIAPEATDLELQYFGEVCKRLNLSPFADQIVLIGRNQKIGDRWQKIHRHQVTVAGRRTLAQRTGNLVGIDGPVWCGPRNRDGELEWREVWDDDDNYPYCARTLVWVKGWERPANGTAKWSEFAQYTDKDKTNLGPTWRDMPSHMLGKVSESLALRRAFPDVIPPEVADGWGDSDEQPAATVNVDPAPEEFQDKMAQVKAWDYQADIQAAKQALPLDVVTGIANQWKADHLPPMWRDDFTPQHAEELIRRLEDASIQKPSEPEPQGYEPDEEPF